MSASDWFSLASLSLNCFLIPLMIKLHHIHIELTKINGRIIALERRSDSVDRRHETQDNHYYNRRTEDA